VEPALESSELLHAFLDAGLTLERFAEVARQPGRAGRQLAGTDASLTMTKQPDTPRTGTIRERRFCDTSSGRLTTASATALGGRLDGVRTGHHREGPPFTKCEPDPSCGLS